MQFFPENVPAAPLLATVFLGANDAALPDGPSARQHVSPAQYAANLRSIVQHLREGGVKNVVLITPPPVSEEARLAFAKQAAGSADAAVTLDRRDAVTQEYATACSQVSRWQ